jgi:hypothetical protein
MSPTQFAWSSLPAKDEPNLSDQLLCMQMISASQSFASTAFNRCSTSCYGPDRGPSPGNAKQCKYWSPVSEMETGGTVAA